MKRRNKFIAIVGIVLCFLSVNFYEAEASSFPDVYTTSVTFPAGYNIGDYVEFVAVSPTNAGASGNYEIAISYTRPDIAAAAIHLAAISHVNPNTWKEVGRISNNQYVDGYMNFTVDCNPQYGSARFRIRAIGTRGPSTIPLTVDIAVTSRNFNSGFTALSNWGNDTSVTKFVPMTNDWDLYVGALTSPDGAPLAIKALQNGNVGIGTATPKEKLSVNGKIRAHEVKVETANWPDYVFQPGYDLLPLLEVEKQVKANGHLPDMPSAKEVENNGLELGEMNKLLLKKIEELTLHLIELKKENMAQQVLLDSINQNYKLLLKNHHLGKY